MTAAWGFELPAGPMNQLPGAARGSHTQAAAEVEEARRLLCVPPDELMLDSGRLGTEPNAPCISLGTLNLILITVVGRAVRKSILCDPPGGLICARPEHTVW